MDPFNNHQAIKRCRVGRGPHRSCGGVQSGNSLPKHEVGRLAICQRGDRTPRLKKYETQTYFGIFGSGTSSSSRAMMVSEVIPSA